MKLLLVEDERRMAQAHCEILRLEGYDTDCRHNGKIEFYAVIPQGK